MPVLQVTSVFRQDASRARNRNNTSRVSSDTSPNASTIKSHDDCHGENLPKLYLNLSEKQNALRNFKKIFTITELCGIFVPKCVCCGCNPLLLLLCHIATNIATIAFKIYMFELHMHFTFSWSHSKPIVTAVIKHKFTKLCTGKNSKLDICKAVYRGDRPLKIRQSLESKLTMQMLAEPFVSSDDRKNRNEVGLSTTTCIAVNNSRSQIKVGLQCSKLTGEESVADKATNKVQLGEQQTTLNNGPHSYREPRVPPSNHYKQHSRKDLEKPIKTWKREEHTQEAVASSGYNKPTYAVLVGRTVMVYDTSRFASLPNCSKFMVKERIKDSSGATKVKLALKSCEEKRYIHMAYYWSSNFFLSVHTV